MMEKFKWGPNFFVLNEKPFMLYSECQNAKELRSTADEYVRQITEERDNNRRRNTEDDMPSDSSEEYVEE